MAEDAKVLLQAPLLYCFKKFLIVDAAVVKYL